MNYKANWTHVMMFYLTLLTFWLNVDGKKWVFVTINNVYAKTHWPSAMIVANHVKRVHPIHVQTKPYVPYFIRK